MGNIFKKTFYSIVVAIDNFKQKLIKHSNKTTKPMIMVLEFPPMGEIAT